MTRCIGKGWRQADDGHLAIMNLLRIVMCNEFCSCARGLGGVVRTCVRSWT